MIAEVARLLHENKVNYLWTVYHQFSTRRSRFAAEMIIKTIKPNVAIVTDVCHDSTTPMIDKKIEGDTNWKRSSSYLCTCSTN
jgi:putative aminopeptidase FrvX